MKILIVSQYFWPENFRINDLVSLLQKKGHQVTVLTGLPNYPEGKLLTEYKNNPSHFFDYQGAKIIRIPHVLRGKRKWQLMLNYLTFFVNASITGAWRLRQHQFDVIFVFAVSPITTAIPAIVLGKLKRAPIFLWVQDLWPETLTAIGAIKSPLLLGCVAGLVRWIYARCDHILIQSRAFFPSIAKHCSTTGQTGRVLYFPNWAESIFSQTNQTQDAPVFQRDENYFTILFAGNIGEAQDFPSILDAVERIKHNRRIRWVMVGDGRAYEWVKEEVTRRGLDQQVKLMGRFPMEMMPDFFLAADALLVTLKADDIFSRTIPAKVQSYLAAGKPILCMVDGEARVVIDESGAGMSCAAGDAIGLSECAQQMSWLSKEELIFMGQQGRQYYQAHFERNKLVNKLEFFFQAAIAGQTLSDELISNETNN